MWGKVVRPGQQAYTEHYESTGLEKAIYQVRATEIGQVKATETKGEEVGVGAVKLP